MSVAGTAGLAATTMGGVAHAYKKVVISRSTVRTVPTFNVKKFTRDNFITFPSDRPLQIKLPLLPSSILSNWIGLKDADPAFTKPNMRLRGFLYYHVAHPPHFLSGGLRFRYCRHEDDFWSGSDLPDRFGLPWQVSLTTMLIKQRMRSYTQQLVLDGLLTPEQITAGRRILHGSVPVGTLMHQIGQSFVLDLSARTEISVVGPRTLLRAIIHTRIAHSGTVIAHLERAPHPGELYMRVTAVHSPIEYLHPYAHLPEIKPGNLLPYRNGKRPWGWTYDDSSPASAAALHCLFNPVDPCMPPSYGKLWGDGEE